MMRPESLISVWIYVARWQESSSENRTPLTLPVHHPCDPYKLFLSVLASSGHPPMTLGVIFSHSTPLWVTQSYYQSKYYPSGCWAHAHLSVAVGTCEFMVILKFWSALSGSEVFGGRYDAYRPLPRSLVSPLMMLEHSGTVCTGRTGGVRVTFLVSGFAAIRLMFLASEPYG